MTKSSNDPDREPRLIRRMFDEIAPTYDLLNHILSFGLDIRWRRKAVRMLEEKKGGKFLDIAAGSGDVTLEVRSSLEPAQVVATDFAQRMLAVFRQKLHRAGNHLYPIELVCCDALHLPFLDQSFDATLVAFGIRNFADRDRSLREMHRVLKPHGLSLILELSAPRGALVSRLYQFHANVILPLVGRLVSGHSSAYQYLPGSIRSFPGTSEFLSAMKAAGFTETRSIPLTFGVATIYLGRKGTSP